MVQATEKELERAQGLGGARIPLQRAPLAKENHPVRRVPTRRRFAAGRWVVAASAGTALVVAGNWMVVAPLLASSSGSQTTQLTDCVPHRNLFDVRVGMTRQTVLSTFSSAGHIEQYAPRQNLEVVHRSCALADPWSRLLWITYAWERGEWRVAELHKGLGIVEAS